MSRLLKTDFHLPYNPDLVERARQMRKNMTRAEFKLWTDFLKDHELKFMRQRPIDNYIVDFYCAEKKLAVEVDGDSHYSADAFEYDVQRTNVLKGYGIMILRSTNDDVLKNLSGFRQRISEVLKIGESL
jgi:very-short-patch-repair endonuclease